jgi:SAM-dependent methyltransferase
MPWLTPSRRRGVEVLDDPATPDHVRERAMRDVGRSNRLFGGTRAVLRALPSAAGGRLMALDVGTGTGDIPGRMRGVTTIGLDISEPLLRIARSRVAAVVAGNVLALPFRDGSADIVTCSQLLHHFEGRDLATLVRELDRVSRGLVIVSDIRRSWLAAAGFWLASTALRFHPVTRHDGVVSVLRGFTAREIQDIVRGAIGREPRIHRSAFWRLTVVWEKNGGR